MSNWARPRNLAIGGAALVGLFFLPKGQAKSTNPFVTPGTQNVADRFSAGGGTDTHTPGVATGLGNAKDKRERQVNPTGVSTEAFQNTQADQRPGKPGPFDKAWNDAHHGTEKGR